MSLETIVRVNNCPQFYVVSPKKLAIMSFFTFGLYWWFCFHRNWVLHRKATGEPVLPLVRALFPVIFLYPLMRRIDARIRHSRLEYRWSPLLLKSLYLIGVGPLLLLDQGAWEQFFHIATMLLLTSYGVFIWVIVRIQCAINFSEGDEQGAANAELSLVNWIWMLWGLLFWPSLVLLTVGSLAIGLY
ncbi:hypothetical protein [Pseudomonas vranovensis]|uniref:MFS transporter permease n=1 Tax=Pseudomonas vranovensis TaxID=321661 RepID=A0A423DYB1_9PSED|nr:hypothetical protein [Pseudomonas vranovensis]ROL77415.1 hypothetical protein BHU25_04350 [Pseudomonas vranovensis]